MEKDFKTLNVETWREEFPEDICDFEALEGYFKSVKEKPEADRAVGEKDPREKHFIMPQYLDKSHKYINEFVKLEPVNHLLAHVKLFECFKDEESKQKLLRSIDMLFKGEASKKLSPRDTEKIQKILEENPIKRETQFETAAKFSPFEKNNSQFISFRDRLFSRRMNRQNTEKK